MSDGSSHHAPANTVPGVFNWEMVRKALRAAEEGVYCWDIVHNQIFYTEQCLRMMGLPFHEIGPINFTEEVKTKLSFGYMPSSF